MCWVNIIQRASIEIQYRSTDTDPKTSELPSPEPTPALYSPLDYEAHQIRVLVVDPGPPNAEVSAQFEHTNLKNTSDTQTELNFHALSYCWGEFLSTTNITLKTATRTQPSTLAISSTVDRAIRQLRHPSAPLRIWVDAVCINQSDLEERANQVALMGQIYSLASEVHIWLDEAEFLGFPGAFRMIRDAYNYKHRICPGGEQCACPGSVKHILTTAELDAIAEEAEDNPTFGYLYGVFDRHRAHFDAECVDAFGGGGNVNLAYLLENLFHHPWFQRVWVIQEAILASKATVHSASDAIDWKEILLVNDITSLPEFAGSAANMRMRNSMPSVWKTLVHSRSNTIAGTDNAMSNLQPILQVFLAALDMKATDPRDKLFALLPFGRETGQIGRIPEPLRPDYNKPLSHVMADFTRWWIAEYKSLDILSSVHRQPARAWRRTLCDEDPLVGSVSDDAAGDFPSWAVGVDGYAQWTGLTLCERFPGVFRASGGMIPDATLLSQQSSDGGNGDGLELALRGWRLGSIIALGHPPREMVCPNSPYAGTTGDGDDDDDSLLDAVFHRIFDPSGRTGEWMLLGNNHDSGSDNPAMLERILGGHVDAHYGYMSTPEQTQCVLCPVEGEGEGEAKYEMYEANELPACIEKCFFVIEDGRYGLCPWTAREGDLVVVLMGGNVPYLVRSIGEKSGGKVDKYVLVGECFVQGGLKGNVVEEGRDSEVFLLK